MSKTRENPSVSALEKADYPMNMAFPSQFHLDFSLPLFFAAACSAFP
jgi:hypothetical protein